MREKIVGVLFALVIVFIPTLTILQRTVLKKEKPKSIQVEEQGSIAETNREEQLLMQEALREEQEGLTETPTPTPEPEESWMDSLREGIDDFAGNLALQEEGAELNSNLTSALADDTYIESDQVLAGKGGWLFYKRADDGTPLQDYQGTSTFSDSTMEKIKNNLTATRDYMAGKGIRFVVMIVPNKEIIYSEYMSSTVYRESEITRCDKLYDYLVANSDLEVVYPKADLLEAKKTCQVYYKYDTHWNYAGAYVGIQTLMRQLYGTYVDISEVTMLEENHTTSGDLAALIQLTSKYSDDTFYNFYEENIDASQKVDDHILIVGDSFGDLMQDKLGYFFGQVKQVGVWTFKKATLDTYDADIVVWECVERYADRLHWINLIDD